MRRKRAGPFSAVLCSRSQASDRAFCQRGRANAPGIVFRRCRSNAAASTIGSRAFAESPHSATPERRRSRDHRDTRVPTHGIFARIELKKPKLCYVHPIGDRGEFNLQRR